MTELEHQPVLLKEVLEWMEAKPGACIVDGTVGGGGGSGTYDLRNDVAVKP
jgi:16S rRNA C1402 N4-methylase RsmH